MQYIDHTGAVLLNECVGRVEDLTEKYMMPD